MKPLIPCKIISQNWRIRNQLDATYYFIVFSIGSTCFGHYYAQHQELANIMLITTLVVSFLVCCRLEVSCGWAGVVFGLQTAARTLPQLNRNQEWNDQCGNQHYIRELLMLGIVMPETCWTYRKYNKIISDIYLVFLFFSYHNDARSNKHQIALQSTNITKEHSFSICVLLYRSMMFLARKFTPTRKYTSEM